MAIVVHDAVEVLVGVQGVGSLRAGSEGDVVGKILDADSGTQVGD